jgi:hypothetical protein
MLTIAALARLPLRCINRLLLLATRNVVYDHVGFPIHYNEILTEVLQLPAALDAAPECMIDSGGMFSVFGSVREMLTLLPLLARVRGMNTLS